MPVSSIGAVLFLLVGKCRGMTECVRRIAGMERMRLYRNSIPDDFVLCKSNGLVYDGIRIVRKCHAKRMAWKKGKK